MTGNQTRLHRRRQSNSFTAKQEWFISAILSLSNKYGSVAKPGALALAAGRLYCNSAMTMQGCLDTIERQTNEGQRFEI
jgi:hypothetical protein